MFQRNIVNIVRDDKLICVTSLLQACEKHKLTGEWSLLLITAWHRQHVDVWSFPRDMLPLLQDMP